MASVIQWPLRCILIHHKQGIGNAFLWNRSLRQWHNDSGVLRLSHLHNPRSRPLRLPLPLRHNLFLPRSPIPPLLRPRPPPLRSSLSAGMTQDASSSDAAKTVRVVVKGRVQGVFYRNWTIENANQLGLKGWVRNRRDGSVEALFSGKPEAVEDMEQRCRRGPPAAVVTGFQAFPSTDDPGSGFQRKPTV